MSNSKIYQASDRYSRKHPTRAFLGYRLSPVFLRWITSRTEHRPSLFQNLTLDLAHALLDSMKASENVILETFQNISRRYGCESRITSRTADGTE
jgi:hypothetical protein